MRLILKFLAAALLLASTPGVWANGGGSMPAPSMSSMSRQQTPQQRAQEAYNDGVHYVKKADKAEDYALHATDAGKKDKALHEAQEAYAAAQARFQQALGLDDGLAEAWNYFGYSSRKLGHYEEALTAYEKALALKPGYPDALEYRAEAYLGVNRIADAQQSYLDLYAGNRALAGKLLSAMKSWSMTRHAGGGGASELDEFDKWIQEREQIAGQTAALTRAGTAASWH